MKPASLNILAQTIGLSAIAGMRCMLAPALLSRYFSKVRFNDLKSSPLNVMQRPLIAKALTIMAVGELVGDKLPTAPNRIEAPGLAGRSLCGALMGATIYKADRSKVMIGALVGATVAAAATFASFYIRRGLGKRTDIADPVWGVVEDAIAIGAGICIMKHSQRRS